MQEFKFNTNLPCKYVYQRDKEKVLFTHQLTKIIFIFWFCRLQLMELMVHIKFMGPLSTYLRVFMHYIDLSQGCDFSLTPVKCINLCTISSPKCFFGGSYLVVLKVYTQLCDWGLLWWLLGGCKIFLIETRPPACKICTQLMITSLHPYTPIFIIFKTVFTW